MSEPLDLKTTGAIGGLIAAVIAGLKWFAKWRTPEDAKFDRSQRNDLLLRAKRSEERYDVLEKKYDELFRRFEELSLELLAERRACDDRMAEMEQRMQDFIEARGSCAREGCPSRIDPNESGAFRRALRRESDENKGHKGD